MCAFKLPFTGSEQTSILQALDKSQAVIHFNTDGTILWANENFLATLGYTSLNEIRGKHHSMFVDTDYANSTDYKTFWNNLRSGRFQAGQYRRFGRGGKEIWIQATYNPVLGPNGKPYKIVKFASDITCSVVKTREAFDRVQALIYFNKEGFIQDANENFLKCTGYRLDEIKGRHHSMFCDSTYTSGDGYKEFWAALNRGELQTGEYQRFGKGGREIWLNASYTLRFDNNGDIEQVVKYASDITRQKHIAAETNTAITSASSSLNELTTSIADISRNMGIARDAVHNVQNQTDSANNSVSGMLNSAHAMSQVSAFIQDISGQINLLALNAAIEAARAGDAGRGFAVVADEVKRLASQAETSTGKINEEIKGIQTISTEVANALQQIQGAIQGLVENATTVASTAEQQSAVTQQISMNVTKVAELIH